MKLKQILIIPIVFFSLGQSTIQKEAQSETRFITINRPDSTIQARILITKALFKPNPQKFYYWYANECIHTNQGGFSGYLLHGNYCVFDKNNQLVVKGTFTNGLKTGTWVRWYSNGRRSETSPWRNGLLHGITKIYNEDGTIEKEIRYKNGIPAEKHNFLKFKSINHDKNAADTVLILNDTIATRLKD